MQHRPKKIQPLAKIFDVCYNARKYNLFRCNPVMITSNQNVVFQFKPQSFRLQKIKISGFYGAL